MNDIIFIAYESDIESRYPIGIYKTFKAARLACIERMREFRFATCYSVRTYNVNDNYDDEVEDSLVWVATIEDSYEEPEPENPAMHDAMVKAAIEVSDDE